MSRERRENGDRLDRVPWPGFARVSNDLMMTADGWVATEFAVPEIGTESVLLARRVSEPRLSWLLPGICVWSLFWLVGGLLLWWRSNWWFQLPGGMKLQLILAFGLALSPALLLSLTNIERRWTGHAVRARDVREEGLERRTRQVEESYLLTEEACGRSLRDIFTLPETGRWLKMIRKARGRERLERMSELMARFGELSRRIGWFCEVQRLISADGQAASGFEHRGAERRIEGREALLLFVGRTLLKQWRTDDLEGTTDKASQVLIEANAEDALTMFRGFFPPDDAPGMLLLPYSGIRPWNQGESALMMIVTDKERAVAWLFVSLLNQALWRLHFQQWSEVLAADSWHVTGIPSPVPMLRLADPVASVYVSDSRGERLTMQPVFLGQSSTEAWAALLARETGEGIMVEPPEHRCAETVFVKPAQLLEGLLLRVCESSPTGAADELSARTVDLLAPFAILAAGLVLSVLVARTYLRPLLRLQQAAREVIRERFETRLVIEGGNEFAELARAFNLMAAGIMEGRELRRYVSLSVQQVAGDVLAEHSGVARATEAVILFGAVQGFRLRAESLDADTIMPRLRDHLAAWAGAVRQAGGEVDKFIGDRILAVFFPDRCGGWNAAVVAACTAVQRMITVPTDPALGDWSGIGVAAGPVLSGILGTPEVRLEYTVVGDTVNTRQ
ncbi:MAG TPA: adenylate/guanylate cyclase domain-containing protein, partial [Candidatus Ozemobacteraceae bacterium]|nr:adenylate/guanylate cyclase domain-containing protein [Candidatus Ozemobacteraceae bacterium]